MKILSLTLLIFIFASSPFSYGCHFHQHSGNIRLAHINGRKIYALFILHLGSHAQQARNIITTSNNIADDLISFLRRNQIIMRLQQLAVQQLTQLLASDQIDWIGIELSEEELEGITFNEIKQRYEDMKKSFDNLNDHPQWSPEQTDQILHLMYPKYIIAYAENTELFENTRFVPLEDDSLRQVGRTFQTDKSMALNTLNQLEERGLISHRQHLAVKAFGTGALNQRGLSQITGDNLIDSDELEDLLKAQEIEDPQVITVITFYTNTINNIIRHAKSRDEAIVQSVHNQSGNGIIIMGAAHKVFIEDGLRKSCLSAE